MNELLGIDIGGSGIKGAPVDLTTGQLLTKRYRIPTPKPSHPDRVAKVVAKIVRHFDWKGPTGCTFPGIVKHGVVHSAANLDDAWVGMKASEVFHKQTGHAVKLINDADAAGLAEITFGVGHGVRGVVILLTFGTGIGSGIFVDGRLLPNSELGHLELHGDDAEKYAADKIRKKEKLTWKKWALRVNEYLARVEFLFSPDLIIFGGGVSNKPEKFMRYIKAKAPVVAAELGNNAGIVGAAHWAGVIGD